MIEKIFLDMDGILVDFHAAACKSHKRECPYADPANRGPSELYELWGMSKDDFWIPMDKEWWENLEPTKECFQIMKIVEAHFELERIFILTSPSDNDGCMDGKRNWIRQYLPKYFKRILVGKPKYGCAGPHNLLVDDLDKNINKFKEEGGQGYLFPRYWNTQHKCNNYGLSCLNIILEDDYDKSSS